MVRCLCGIVEVEKVSVNGGESFSYYYVHGGGPWRKAAAQPPGYARGVPSFTAYHMPLL
jgi:hypothetical protein